MAPGMAGQCDLSWSTSPQVLSLAYLAKPLKHVFLLKRTTAAKSSLSGMVVFAPCILAASSQHSNPRIEKSNRRSRFGDPLATTDCGDQDFYDAFPADIESMEMEGLEVEVAGQTTSRELQKIMAGVKRLDNSKVNLGQAQNVLATPQIDLLDRSNEKNSNCIKTRASEIKTKSSVRIKTQVPPAGEGFSASKDWEEQAYQIIRRQKLRNAALTDTKARITQQPPKILVEATEILDTDRESVSTRHMIMPTTGGAGMGSIQFSRLAKQLTLEARWRPLVEYLHTLGLRERDFIKIADRHKSCLRANAEAVKERVEFLVGVGVQSRHLPKLIVRHPQILEYRVEQSMKPRVHYLRSLGLDESKIGQIITVSPSLLECSLARSIKPRLAYLTVTVGVKSQDIGKIITRSPQILTQSIEDALQPRVDFFLNEVNLSKDALAKMVTRHPQLLHYSLEEGIRPRVKYLRSIGMSDDDILKVLTRLTQVCSSLSGCFALLYALLCKNLVVLANLPLEFIGNPVSSRFCAVAEAVAESFALQILSLSVENCLQPKYGYLVTELKGNVQTVTTFPAYFSLSLEQRIIPRHRYLQMLEKSPDGPFPMRLLTISDIAFCKWSKSSVESFNKFRHELLLTTFAKKFQRKNNLRI